MKTKRIATLIIILSVTLLYPGKPAKAATPFRDLAAVSAVLAEAGTGEVLFGHNINRRHPADALSKNMTLLLAVTACANYEADPREIIEMTESACTEYGAGDSPLLTPGEEITLLDLMYCAYVGGSKEACNMIAEHISGSVGAFVTRMNAYAREIGCENTNFTNTHGQYNINQYTTAMDQFSIHSEAIVNPLFAEISGTYRYTTAATNLSEPRTLVGSNSLLNTSGKYYFAPCMSGLASATYEGGYSFVAFAEADELSLISVVLGSDVIILEDESTQMRNLTEARRLFEWGFSQFGWRTILSSTELVDKAPVTDGAGADFVNLRPESSIRLVLDNDIPLEQFVRDVTIYSVDRDEPLVAPVMAGDILGEITITYNGIKYGPIRLVANTNVELHRLVFIKMQIIELLSGKLARIIIWTLSLLVVAYIALVVRYNVIRQKRLRRIKAAKRKLAEERQRQQRQD